MSKLECQGGKRPPGEQDEDETGVTKVVRGGERDESAKRLSPKAMNQPRGSGMCREACKNGLEAKNQPRGSEGCC